LHHRTCRFSIVAALMVLWSGCGNEQLPDAPPGASRAMMENPLGAAKEAKQAKVSAKTKAALENAAKADPRGK